MSTTDPPLTHNINSTTVGGTFEFFKWMVRGGYGTEAQVTPWRVAMKMVFSTVEGTEDYEPFDWSTVDLDEYMDRFQKLAGAKYKSESIVAYGRRVRNGIDAHKHYLETGRAPTSKPATSRKKKDTQPAAASGGNGNSDNVTPITAAASAGGNQPGMVSFPYPLSDGNMATLVLPRRLAAEDVTRLTTFIRTLEEENRRQLPPGSSEAA
jgi:hypothetical protein